MNFITDIKQTMNYFLRTLVTAFAFFLYIYVPTAHGQSAVPIISLEQHPELVALSLDLSKKALTIQVTNKSNTKKSLVKQDFTTFIKCCYVDSKGNRVPLPIGIQKLDNDPRTYDGDGPLTKTFLSGGQITREITMTSEERHLLKAYPVVIVIHLYDPATKQQYMIESSPKLLTEAVAK
jgi:hypothetical protein